MAAAVAAVGDKENVDGGGKLIANIVLQLLLLLSSVM